MSLEDLVKEHNPRKRDGHCPECGAEGEQTDRLEIKCPSDPEKCNVMYWFPVGG